MSDEMAELKKRLKEAFEVATKLYQERGFQRRIGFGRKPALANVDCLTSAPMGHIEGFS